VLAYPGCPGKKAIKHMYVWHIHSVIFVPKITEIRQLLLKLSLVVGWYTFLQHSVEPQKPEKCNITKAHKIKIKTLKLFGTAV